jgi:TonB family protein
MKKLSINFRLAIKLTCLVMIGAVCVPDQRASAWMRFIPSLTASDQSLIPPASKPCTEEERNWWEELRKAASDAAEAGNRKQQAFIEGQKRQTRERGYASTADEDLIPPKKLAQLNAEIAAATEKYLRLVWESREKSFSVPLPDAPRFVVFHRVKAKYTDAARRDKVQGVVILSVVFSADGKVDDIKVLRGLSHGLDETAEAAARQLLFLPAIKEGKFISVRQQLEFSYNLY